MGVACSSDLDERTFAQKLEKLIYVDERTLETGLKECGDLFGSGGSVVPDFGILSANGDHVREALRQAGFFTHEFSDRLIWISSDPRDSTESGMSFSELKRNDLQVESGDPLTIVPATASSSVEEVSKRQPHLVTLVFKPGPLGVDLSVKSGAVKNVKGGQAGLLGVRVGWVMSQIDGRSYSEQLLVSRIRGDQDYVVTFTTLSGATPVDSISQRSRSRSHRHRRKSSHVEEDDITLEEFFQGLPQDADFKAYRKKMEVHYKQNTPLNLRYQDLRKFGIDNAYHRSLIMDRAQFMRDQIHYLDEIFERLPPTPAFRAYRRIFRRYRVSSTTSLYLNDATLEKWGITVAPHREGLLRSIIMSFNSFMADLPEVPDTDTETAKEKFFKEACRAATDRDFWEECLPE